VSATTETRAGSAANDRRLHTIGAVCQRLKAEFPDVSISKIRYLEDQGLLSPRRTPGGYRLFSEEDVERLETILRLQRDEFLPLRVIRQELSSPSTKARRRKRTAGLGPEEPELELGELCERAGISSEFARELAEYGLLEARVGNGARRFGEADVEVAQVCARMARYGMSARHLRAFRTTTDRETGLLEQLVAPALRSRNQERRRTGLDDLQALAELSQELSQLLLWRSARRIAAS